MTNEEAISIINQYDVNFYWTDGEPIPADKLAEAFDLAIEALKREQQFLDAGYENERVEFYIGGRKFMVKELAQ